MYLIKNGYVIENNSLVKKDVLIQDHLIERIEENIEAECEVLNANGCLIMPGAVDVHVHLREPGYEYKETVETGSKSSLKGGVTTIMSMPNLKPAPSTYETLKQQLDIIEKDACIKVIPYGTITMNQSGRGELAQMEEMANYVCDKYNWTKVDCVENDSIKSIDEIHNEIYNCVKVDLDNIRR